MVHIIICKCVHTCTHVHTYSLTHLHVLNISGGREEASFFFLFSILFLFFRGKLRVQHVCMYIRIYTCTYVHMYECMQLFLCVIVM